MNFLIAIVIGAVVGVIGWFLMREKQSNAIWLAPLLGIGGALVASVAAALWGSSPGYGWREATLQVVLAVGAVGALAFLTLRGTGSAGATGR